MSLEHPSIRVTVGRPTHEPGAPRRDDIEPEPATAHEGRAAQTPLIDIHEGPEGLVLEADLPGVAEDGITIQLEDNVLTLHARVGSPAPDGARPLHEEYRVGDYFRSFILSDEVERARIAAELKNGVLRLSLPKAERAKTRRIEIKS